MMVQNHTLVKGWDSVVRAVASRLGNTLAVVSLGTLLVLASHAQSLITNGSFETPISNNQWSSDDSAPDTYGVSEPFGGWNVEFGNIDINHFPSGSNSPTYPDAYHGAQYVDLNGAYRGAIYQDFTVVSGQAGLYQLHFALNATYVILPDYRQMRVQILQGVNLIFSQDYTHFYDSSFSVNAQPWNVHTASVVLGVGTYRLRFESLESRLTNGSYATTGPYLDDVRLELVPEPASMVALGMGLAGLLGLRRRRQC